MTTQHRQDATAFEIALERPWTDASMLLAGAGMDNIAAARAEYMTDWADDAFSVFLREAGQLKTRICPF